MPNGWGQYSTPPASTSVATPLTEGTLPPFPEMESVVDDDQKLTPIWKHWFAKQRSWLSDRGAYKPTDFTYFSMGTGVVSGTPVLQWWKQGNIVQVTLDIKFATISVGGGTCVIAPLPFDPTIKMLSAGGAPRPVFSASAMALVGSTYSALPCFFYNDKPGGLAKTMIQLVNIPVNCIQVWFNGTYITDN